MGQKGFALVGDVILDHSVEGGIEKLPQLRPRFDAGANQIAAVDGKHLERIGLPCLRSPWASERISSIVST